MLDYEFLNEYNPQQNSKAMKIKNFISNAIDMIFGAFGPFEKEPEQKGHGLLKILTPKQMIIILSILLSEVKAGINSQKLN